MALTLERLRQIQSEYFADDLPIISRMTLWDEDAVRLYFESGGTISPDETSAEESRAIDGDVVQAQSGDAAAAARAVAEVARSAAAAARAVATSLAAAALTEVTEASKDSPTHLESMGQPELDSLPTVETFAALTTKELRLRLRAAGVSTEGCCERGDFEALAREHGSLLPSSGGGGGGDGDKVAEVGGGGGGGDTREGGGVDFWLRMSTKDLRQLLADRHVDTVGCLDRDDLLEVAGQHRASLLAAGPTAAAPAAAADLQGPTNRAPAASSDEQRSAAQSGERVRAMLDHLGGVVHGGYQVDPFGAKRGRCQKNPRCFRYKPANVKMNGCGMQGTGAVRCTRCGFDNLSHEHLGTWVEGDPQLVDEHGNGFRFTNAAEGGVKLVPISPPTTRGRRLSSGDGGDTATGGDTRESAGGKQCTALPSYSKQQRGLGNGDDWVDPYDGLSTTQLRDKLRAAGEPTWGRTAWLALRLGASVPMPFTMPSLCAPSLYTPLYSRGRGYQVSFPRRLCRVGEGTRIARA